MAEATLMNTRLKCHALSHKYNDNRILESIDFSVGKGETVALMGRSGCGKSTFLKCLNMLENPHKGNLYLDGQQYMDDGNPIFELWELRKLVTLVFQEFNLFPNMTALKNITLALEETKKVNKADAKKKAFEVSESLGIEKILEKYPNQLSGGESQRVALARSLVLEPKVLLLDEITAALDPESIANVVDAIRKLRDVSSNGELSIIFVTHLVRFATEFADRVLFLHEGKFVEDLAAGSFVKDCSHPVARNFVEEMWAV